MKLKMLLDDALEKVESTLDDYAAVEPTYVPLKFHDLKDAQKSLTEAIAIVAAMPNVEVSDGASLTNRKTNAASSHHSLH